ncbi:MAG: polysaccharide deacetylase family protein [Lachnospiraceae bacterium]|nr:polysaccharide deacetylase family protein [Lachnospiraceae bacterium]
MKIKTTIKTFAKMIKESRVKANIAFWALALFVCMIFAIRMGEKVVAVSSTYGDRELPIYCVDTEEKKISISFDAAWGAEDFQNIMDILDKHEVKTTFFMTGEWVEKYPDCVKMLVEKGHDLGNHSATHPDMTTLSKEEQRNQILEVHNAVKELTGYEMELFRPPYGAYNNEVIRTCYEVEYYPIQWNVDSLDWKDYEPAQIIDNVCNHKALGAGSIILCHNGAKYTAKALDEMLTNLKEQGYELVPISELIIREDFHMDVTGKQIADES